MTDGQSVAGSGAPDQAPVAPAKAGERIASLDFIRGIAVLGILAANIVAFGQPFAAYMYPAAFAVPHGEASNWLWVAQFVLIDGKMRGLFTLLFGAGLVLFMDKAWARGRTRWLQVRRLFWLGLFGLIHFFLIWRGDILFSYAVCGLVAVLCLKWSIKTQLVVGLLGYLVGALLYLAMIGPTYFVADTELGEHAAFAEMRADLERGKATELQNGHRELEIISDGRYGDFVANNVTEHASDLSFYIMLWVMETLPLMLVGMALYRLGLFSGGFDPARQRRWGWIGLIGGGLLTLPIALWAKATGFTYYATLAAFVGFSPLPRLAMVLGLAALLALWGAKARGWLAVRLAAAGRAAFTNYLGTSLAMMLVFHGWAGGLYGELGRPALYLVVLGMWVLMLAWSKPWLERFRYGPLEWLWRCLTYGRVFALRR
ncbi:DUF418 domain-containing protein [Pelagerythrobacter marensis]|uniref:DUF418 domain-containing protein n=1 Tax=Pelagerythrobacter marensis TaxID=543877 RepID=A0ABZ2D416_9SPHN